MQLSNFILTIYIYIYIINKYKYINQSNKIFKNFHYKLVLKSTHNTFSSIVIIKSTFLNILELKINISQRYKQ